MQMSPKLWEIELWKNKFKLNRAKKAVSKNGLPMNSLAKMTKTNSAILKDLKTTRS